MPGWIWAAASLTVLAISLSFILALAWGLGRAAGGAQAASTRRRRAAARSRWRRPGSRPGHEHGQRATTTGNGVRSPRRHRDRRQRVRRARHGLPAAAGGDRRLRDPRARRGRGRHVVVEHLPRLPVRHPVAPLLVLVRTEPGVEPHVSASARDPGVPAATAPRSSASCRTSASDSEVERGAWDEEHARWELETSAGTITARVVVGGQGGLSEPSSPRHPGARQLRRAVVPLGAVGPLAWT